MDLFSFLGSLPYVFSFELAPSGRFLSSFPLLELFKRYSPVLLIFQNLVSLSTDLLFIE